MMVVTGHSIIILFKYYMCVQYSSYVCYTVCVLYVNCIFCYYGYCGKYVFFIILCSF